MTRIFAYTDARGKLDASEPLVGLFSHQLLRVERRAATAMTTTTTRRCDSKIQLLLFSCSLNADSLTAFVETGQLLLLVAARQYALPRQHLVFSLPTGARYGRCVSCVRVFFPPVAFLKPGVSSSKLGTVDVFLFKQLKNTRIRIRVYQFAKNIFHLFSVFSFLHVKFFSKSQL